MGSLFEEIEEREAASRARVEELQGKIAELTARLEAERECLSRLVITRETVEELAAEKAGAVEETERADGTGQVSGEAVGAVPAEMRVVGVQTVPVWRPGLAVGVLPKPYRDIAEVVQDAPGPVRAKQIAPRIGLPAQTAKIEGTRSKLKRLVERGWLDEDAPGLFTPARRRVDENR